VFFVAVAVLVVALDQWTKFLVLDTLTNAFDGKVGLSQKLGVFLGEAPPALPEGYHFGQRSAITLSESFFRLRYAENPGAAFGLFRTVPDGLRGPLFHLVSLGAVVLITFYFRKLKGLPEERFARIGLPLVLGGAIGNYIDRLARSFVIDFLEAHWFDKATWPSFNVADSAIVVGVGLLIIDSFVRKEA
jgi:signal peptidase II